MVDDRGRSGVVVRACLSAAVTLAAGALAGCPPVRKPVATRPVEAAVPLVPALGSEPVSGGIFVSLGSYVPLSGDALNRAKTDRGTIRASVAAQVPASHAPATQPAPAEAPPLAVKYYLQGREKFLDGANTEAMEFLDKALQLDPNAFTVLRLMGRVCFASSQLARGTLYLERAQRARPADVEVNYLLGRYWLERKVADRAIYYLMLADDSPERTTASAQTPLVSFYLARSLQAAGYHQAAAGEYEAFLAEIELPVAEYRYDRELNYLMEERWATELSIAENDVLLGDFARALPHYQAAAREQPADVFIASRLVNAQMQLHQNDAARQAALDLAMATRSAGTPAEPALQLLAWVYRTQHREPELIADLQARMGSAGGEAAALTFAATLDYMGRKPEAFAALADYLNAHPGDLDVLGRLLRAVDSPATFAGGLRAAARAMDADPAAQERVLQLFLPAITAAGTLPDNFLAADAGASELYLAALTQEARHADPAAIDAAFAASLRLKPAFLPAREAYVTWLLSQEKYARASALIQEAVDQQQGGAKTWQLLVESEVAQQRLSHALELAKEAQEKFPRDPDVRLQLASIYRLRGQDDQADAELNALIDAFPKYEAAYQALIGSLIQRGQENGQDLNAALGTIVTLLGRMNRELPDSTYAQVTSATVYARAGRFEEAEGMLEHLLTLHPDDPDILVPLAQVRQILGRPEDAVSLLADSLKARPQLRVAEALVDVYHRQGRDQDAAALTARLVHEHPDNEGYALLQASIPMTAKKNEETIALLTAAAGRFPRSQEIALALAQLQQTAGAPAAAVRTLQAFIKANGETPERLYTLSHFYSAAGDDDASVAALERVLALMPDHTGANNDLGYFWTDAGIHLDEAARMIKKAVDNEPNNSAFLDSMGWLEYKRGRFAEAITWLEKAVAQPDGMESDVVRHLGDALYRAGRKGEALERWTQAQSLLSIESPTPGIPAQEREKLKSYLDGVTAAARAGRTPALTPTAAPPRLQSAGPTTLRTLAPH